MTVQELFKSIDTDDFVEDYISFDKYFANMTLDKSIMPAERIAQLMRAKQHIADAFDHFKELEGVVPGTDVVFCEPATPDDYENVHTFVVKADELDAYNGKERLETYAYEFEEDKSILGYQVADVSRFMLDNLRCASVIFYELTYFGYDVETRSKERGDVIESLKQAQKDIEEGNTVPAEDVFKKLGWTDTRKPFEKKLEWDMMTAYSRYTQTARKKMFLTEQRYRKGKK